MHTEKKSNRQISFATRTTKRFKAKKADLFYKGRPFFYSDAFKTDIDFENLIALLFLDHIFIKKEFGTIFSCYAKNKHEK